MGPHVASCPVTALKSFPTSKKFVPHSKEVFSLKSRKNTDNYRKEREATLQKSAALNLMNKGLEVQCHAINKCESIFEVLCDGMKMPLLDEESTYEVNDEPNHAEISSRDMGALMGFLRQPLFEKSIFTMEVESTS